MENTQETLSNLEVSMLLLGIFGTLAIAFIIVYALCEPEDAWHIVTLPFVFLRKSKQSNCMHLWRRMDADYSTSVVFYRYRCQKCKAGKELDQYAAEKFEKDFMSDWD